MQRLEDLTLTGKRVLIRADFNVPLNNELAITDDNRIKEFLPTLKYVIEKGGLPIVMSHFGTFYDEYKFTQLKYFDRNGRLISKSEEYHDMTNEPMKIKPEDYETADLRDKIDYYMTVSKLPFAHLLPPKAK